MIRLKVFISSVQKELEPERRAIGAYLSTDEFLSACTAPRLFEDYPQPLRPNPKGYLDLLRQCQVYLLLLGETYGTDAGSGLSATHQEYRLARELNLPVLVCVKGQDADRVEAEKAFFQEIKADGHTYSRFDTEKKLLEVVGKRLREHIETTFAVEPRRQQEEQSRLNAQSASPWEREPVTELELQDLDLMIGREMMAAAEEQDREKIPEQEVPRLLLSRGYLWQNGAKLRPTRAGALLLAHQPGRALTQARMQVDVFPGPDRNTEALDTDLLDLSLPALIETTVAFIRRNSAKTFRVKGLKREELPQYPTEVLRELVVNAVAHRDYADPGAKTLVQLFQDRLEVDSPGHPPGGQSVRKLQSGQARSRARNPLIVQGLRWLELMDERGSGIARMNRLIAQAGLPPLSYQLDHDVLQVILRTSEAAKYPGSELRKPEDKRTGIDDLPPRKAILAEVRANGKITTKICVQRLGDLQSFRLTHPWGIGGCGRAGETRRRESDPLSDEGGAMMGAHSVPCFSDSGRAKINCLPQIWRDLARFGAIWCDSVRFDVKRLLASVCIGFSRWLDAVMRRFEAIWRDLARFGVIWSCANLECGSLLPLSNREARFPSRSKFSLANGCFCRRSPRQSKLCPPQSGSKLPHSKGLIAGALA